MLILAASVVVMLALVFGMIVVSLRRFLRSVLGRSFRGFCGLGLSINRGIYILLLVLCLRILIFLVLVMIVVAVVSFRRGSAVAALSLLLSRLLIILLRLLLGSGRLFAAGGHKIGFMFVRSVL
jgi:hypothetical protein